MFLRNHCSGQGIDRWNKPFEERVGQVIVVYRLEEQGRFFDPE